jgi:hypothetical protein
VIARRRSIDSLAAARGCRVRCTRVMHVVTAVITAEGEFTMTTTEEQALTASGAVQEPKGVTKPAAH